MLLHEGGNLGFLLSQARPTSPSSRLPNYVDGSGYQGKQEAHIAPWTRGWPMFCSLKQIGCAVTSQHCSSALFGNTIVSLRVFVRTPAVLRETQLTLTELDAVVPVLSM